MTAIRKYCTSYEVYLFETECAIVKKPHPKWGLPPIPQPCVIPVDGTLMMYSLRELRATGRILLHPVDDVTLDFPCTQCALLDHEERQAYDNAHGV